MANKVGVSASSWSRWETGTTTPTMVDLYKISMSFHFSLDYLVLGIDSHSIIITRLIALLSNINERELIKIMEWIEIRIDIESDRPV